MDRYAQLAIISAMQAIQDSGMNLEEIDKNRVGVIYGVKNVQAISSSQRRRFSCFVSCGANAA